MTKRLGWANRDKTGQNAHKEKVQMLWYEPQTKMMPGIMEDMWKMLQDEPFQGSVQKFQESAVHNMEKEADKEQETDIEMVNINSVKFNSNVLQW